MSSVKQALEKDIERVVPEMDKQEMGRLLFEKMIEKKRRQDEKYRVLVQGVLLVSLVVFLLYMFAYTPDLATYQTMYTSSILALTLFFAHICQRIIALLGHGK